MKIAFRVQPHTPQSSHRRERSPMDEQEMLDALMRGAVLFVDPATGESEIEAVDDVPPKVRECIRASRKRDWAHQSQCPDCLEDEAQAVLMDAASHREDGNEATTLELEAEAAELLKRAARLRQVKEA
jgi:hypothetical protein